MQTTSLLFVTKHRLTYKFLKITYKQTYILSRLQSQKRIASDLEINKSSSLCEIKVTLMI